MSESPTMRARIESVKGSVEDLVTWCMQRGLHPAQVELTGGHLRWFTPETEDEATARAEWQARATRRADEWERETYARLKAKFEAEPPDSGASPDV